MEKRVSITFRPEGKTIEVKENTNLWEAATRAGIYINSVCGGDGICGK